MKTMFKILILLFVSQITKAECGSGFTFYPKSPTVYKNTKILIEGYGWTKYLELLKELDCKYPIFLKNKNRRIRLIKDDLIIGQYGLYQAIFSLEKPLTGGESYEIEVQNLNEKDGRYFNNIMRRTLNGKYEKLVWLAKD